MPDEVLDLLFHWEASPPPRLCPRCGEPLQRATPGEPCQSCQETIYTEIRIAEFEEAEAREKEAYYECH